MREMSFASGASLAALLMLAGPLGCAGYQAWWPWAAETPPPPPPASPAPTAGAAGLGFDVEYIEPQRIQQPRESLSDSSGKEMVFFPVKFACGDTGPEDPLPPASHSTLINVINLFDFFRIQVKYHFMLGPNTVESDEIMGPLSTRVLDCAFILSRFATLGVDPNRFHEGFVLIEDTSLRALRVSAIYSAFHKQLHSLPDLVPVHTAPEYCRLEQGRLIVTIKNVGEREAPATTTEVELEGGVTLSRATAALVPGEEVDLDPIDMQFGGSGRYLFTIRADRPGEVLEANEANNVALGACVFIR